MGKTVKSGFTITDSNILKGIAILLMLFHHLFNDYEEYAGFVVSYVPFSGDRLTALAITGKICVSMFLFVTGYGIAAGYRKEFEGNLSDRVGLGRFIWKRWYKLMCGYWFAFFITLICQPLGRTISDAYGAGIKGIISYAIVDFFGLSWFFGTPTLNPTWWYMSVAIAAVVLLPIIMIGMDLFGTLTILAVVMLVVMLAGPANGYTFYIFTGLLGTVAFRAGFFERMEKHMKKHPLVRTGMICMSVLAMALLLIIRGGGYNTFGVVEGLIALAAACLVKSLICLIPGVSKGLAFLGKYSAGMFLLHNQIYSFYFTALFYSVGHWLLILMLLAAVSLGVSILVEWIKNKVQYLRWMNLLAQKGLSLIQNHAVSR